MDELLLLLMHQNHGLTITDHELLALLKADPHDSRMLLACLRSSAATKYFEARLKWREESLRVLDESAQFGVRWSRVGADDYPRGWLQLSRRPLVFSYQGEPCWLRTSLIAVVGSRTPMIESRMWMQRELSLFLRRSDCGVVSGGARGIDQWAHRLSLDERKPTVCVLPSGILNPYPPGSQEVWDRIKSGGGCLLSTFSLREPMFRNNFPIRNRWIVGFSTAVFVVEANRRSGSALTAKLAKDEGREIWTLPVFPHSEQGLGNLDLIADGAGLMRDHHDLAIAWDSCRLRPGFFQ
jgi:DNA processing protein